MAERDFIQQIAKTFKAHPQIPLGVGDDCGIVQLMDGREALVTTDMLMDGIHFDLAKIPGTLAGRKALAVNLSDIAAMGGRPVCALVSLALERETGAESGCAIMKGIVDLAKEWKVGILGGDTNSWRGKTVISITVIGEPGKRPPVQRRGAQLGDAILVTGSLGGSLASGRHLSFTPRVTEAALLNERYELTSMIDLSDGLATDLRHITEASGVAAELDPDQIPISPDVEPKDPTASLRAALCDGEDFELCLTAPPRAAQQMLDEQILKGVKIHRIGTIAPGSGLYWRQRDGKRELIPWCGYEHAL